MGVQSSAREHMVASWWVGCPEMAQAEAERRHLALLHDAVKKEIAAHAREMVEHEGVSWAAVALVLEPGGGCGPGSLRTLMPSCEQAEGVQVEAAGQGVDGVQGQIALAALDARQVAGRHSQVLGEGLLCQGAAVPLGA